ncbi:MAG: SURF1 family protein [Alphaproteobacteria bacterium]|nr:SURF1 family protein [Alphaproteobacteria bacterium]MCD8520130.1 SURF1 family protein [Alphaproteobacteria bacterium]MCD8525947.1 SURF1 family protein [Alphaproteobacteria bacterium]MCD8571081.1 SURF1 family protein [Alphaproteobacteria bacterium]
MPYRFQKPPLVASILTLGGISVLCGLGTWQLQRLAQKEEFLAQIARWQETPQESLTFDDFSDEAQLYKPGTLQGHWLDNAAVKLIPRSYDGKAGAHIYTPLDIGEGRIVIVNRGWVPQGYDLPESPSGSISLTGEIGRFPTPNMFTPDNPADTKEWYRVSVLAFQAALGDGNEVAPLALRQTRDDSSLTNLPLTDATKPQINNNHASYAAFWFAMAGIMAGVFTLRFLCKKY